MKKIILSIFCVLVIFGCGADNSSSSVNTGSIENGGNIDTGDTGGETGNTGDSTGDTGDTGNTGNTGDTGGETGNTGGSTGDTGDTGNTGNTGDTDGETGNTGGSTGDTGDSGNTGNTGDTDGEAGNTGGSTGDNETTEQEPEDNETVPSISDGGIIDNITSTNFHLYTISSHIPQTPTDNLPAAVYYSLAASNNNTSASMKKYIENSSENINNDGNRNIIKQQIDFNNTVKEKNIKPIKKNNLSLYKTVPANISVNTKWNNIWITDTATMQQSLTSATCIYISDNVYYFLDDRVSLADIDISRIAYIEQQFETAYQKVHEKCGQENDVDNNGKIIFLFTPIGNNVLGFFYSADKYSDTLTSPSGIHSNEADVMYVESAYLLNNTDWESNKAKLTATLIHEFHHMALFDVRTNTGVEPFMDYWINEGFSTLTAYYTGYPAIMRDYILNFFAFETDISLVNNTPNLSYGYSYLFMRYFYYRFGDEGLKKIIKSAHTGYKAVEEASNMNFNDLYKDFIKMILVTGRNVTDDARYNVPEFNYKENTQEYLSSYISLAEMLDIFIDTPPFTDIFTTYSGYEKTNAVPYTFQYKKWQTMPESIVLKGTNTTTFYTLF